MSMTQEAMEFVVYMIHACANRWKLSLHTQGSGYLVDDIAEYLHTRGVAI